MPSASAARRARSSATSASATAAVPPHHRSSSAIPASQPRSRHGSPRPGRRQRLQHVRDHIGVECLAEAGAACLGALAHDSDERAGRAAVQRRRAGEMASRPRRHVGDERGHERAADAKSNRTKLTKRTTANTASTCSVTSTRLRPARVAAAPDAVPIEKTNAVDGVRVRRDHAPVTRYDPRGSGGRATVIASGRGCASCRRPTGRRRPSRTEIAPSGSVSAGSSTGARPVPAAAGERIRPPDRSGSRRRVRRGGGRRDEGDGRHGGATPWHPREKSARTGVYHAAAPVGSGRGARLLALVGGTPTGRPGRERPRGGAGRLPVCRHLRSLPVGGRRGRAHSCGACSARSPRQTSG